MDHPSRFRMLLVAAALAMISVFTVSSPVAESHDVGRRTKFHAGTDFTPTYYAIWNCNAQHPSYPDGGWHPEGANPSNCAGGNEGISSLDLQTPAEHGAWMYALSTDNWGLDAWDYQDFFPSSVCTGVVLRVWDPGIWEELGRVTYLHIWRLPSLPRDLGIIGAGERWEQVGIVEDWQEPGCGWTDPHLHQSGTSGWQHTFANWGIPNPIDGNNWNHWVHEMRW